MRSSPPSRENAGAWNNRGCVLQGMNRNEEALAAFEKASSLKPDFIEALISGGSVLAALKRFEEAAQNYEKALAPQSGPALCARQSRACTASSAAIGATWSATAPESRRT